MGVLSIIRTPVVTETCRSKTKEVYERLEAHHSEPAHTRSIQGSNVSKNSTHSHTMTPNQYIKHHTLIHDV